MNNLFPLMVALLASIVAQSSKPCFAFVESGTWDWGLVLGSGGFPSSHSATVTALTTAIFLLEGVNSLAFSLSVVFTFIVIYDAINVRYYAGKNIQLTKQIIHDLDARAFLNLENPIYQEKIKTILGHKLSEAIAGVFCGIVTTLICYLVLIVK